VDESLTVPARPTEADEVRSCDSPGRVVRVLTFFQDDPFIDFIDELGRSKPMRRSKIPKLLGVGRSQILSLLRSLTGFFRRERRLSSSMTMMGNLLRVPSLKYHHTSFLRIQTSM